MVKLKKKLIWNGQVKKIIKRIRIKLKNMIYYKLEWKTKLKGNKTLIKDLRIKIRN